MRRVPLFASLLLLVALGCGDDDGTATPDDLCRVACTEYRACLGVGFGQRACEESCSENIARDGLFADPQFISDTIDHLRSLSCGDWQACARLDLRACLEILDGPWLGPGASPG